MKYVTTTEIGKRWNLSARRVGILCAQGRIPEVQKAGNTWLIPEDAVKPVDARIRSGRYINKKKEVSANGCSDEYSDTVER
ncbi:MAG: DNA-binding protein [Ruminococcus sp.]|nr:DNA-binding protein [Ruminococcus sp.]